MPPGLDGVVLHVAAPTAFVELERRPQVRTRTQGAAVTRGLAEQHEGAAAQRRDKLSEEQRGQLEALGVAW